MGIHRTGSGLDSDTKDEGGNYGIVVPSFWGLSPSLPKRVSAFRVDFRPYGLVVTNCFKLRNLGAAAVRRVGPVR